MADELCELTKQRSRMYLFLARIYRDEVDEEFLNQIRSSLQAMDFKDPEIAAGYDELKSFIEQFPINPQTVAELAADYAGLFLGIARNPAHPYESVYLSKEKIAMRQRCLEVAAQYHQEGLVKTEGNHEPADHVAAELEFMSFLCRKTLQALDRSDSGEVSRLVVVQDQFMTVHLGAWLKSFCDSIVGGTAKLDFYRALAKLTRRFLEVEKRYLPRLKAERAS